MKSHPRARLVLASAALAAAASAAEAGATATVVKGVLQIRGDAGNDELAVAPSPDTPGMVRVEALDTLVNGMGFVDFPGVKAVDVDLGDGDDLLRIGADEGRLALKGVKVADGGGTLDCGLIAADVKGNVDVRLGSGADILNLVDTTVSGTVLGDLDPRAGGGTTDGFGVLNSQIGTLNLFCGPGDEQPTVGSSDASSGSASRFKNVTLDLGDGNDFLSFNNSEVTGLLRIAGGPGDDTLGLLFLPAFSATPLKLKALDVDAGDGRDICVVGNSTTPGSSVGKVVFRGGAGDDVLALNHVAVLLTVDGVFGDGADQYSSFEGSVKKTLKVDLGAGDDILSLLETEFLGGVTAAGGDGTNDNARLRAGLSFKLAPSLSGFETGTDVGAVIAVQSDADSGDRIELNLGTGAYQVFVDSGSVATGTATMKAKGANLTFTAAGGTHPFSAKVNFVNRSAKAVVKPTGGAAFTITDSDTTDNL
jgi:hypothetical protein